MDKAQWPLWLLAGHAHYGTREHASGHNGNILNFFVMVRAFDSARDEIAWCAAYEGACYERVGLRSTRSLMAKSYLDWGLKLSEPRIGCAAVFDRGDNPDLGHVTNVVEIREKTILCQGGNQSDSVCYAEYSKADVRAYRWPGDAEQARLSDVFDIAYKYVVSPEVEGGYTDDPYDNGGPTFRGVTIGTLAAWREVNLESNYGALKAELQAGLSEEEVRAIYVTRYWFASWADQLPPALAVMHFDSSVNQGVRRAAEFLQRAIGSEVDGEMGPDTLALARVADVREALRKYSEAREQHYRGIATFWRFGKGWLARNKRTLDLALSVANSALSPEAQPKEKPLTDTVGTAPSPTPEPAPVWWGKSVTIWGILITAASTVLPVLARAAGIDITPELISQFGTDVTTVASAIGGLVGTVMAIWGRVKASRPLTTAPVQLKI
ncbi:TIGR02594 family protein [Hyphomicrobium album]|nr:TIGR02594 family protein [Hyphomicrobium album]